MLKPDNPSVYHGNKAGGAVHVSCQRPTRGRAMCWTREEEELRRLRLRSQHGITRLPQVGDNQFNLGAMIKWSDFRNFQGLKGLGCV